VIVLKIIGAFLLYAIALVPFWLLLGWYLNRVAEKKRAAVSGQSASESNPDTIPHSAGTMRTTSDSLHTAALPSLAADPTAAN
jgi:hypothetical protein